MKKIVLISGAALLLFVSSCNRIAEAPPAEQSIESVKTATGDKVLLRLKPKVGDTQNMQMEMIMKMSGDQAGETKVNSKMELNVTDKKDDVYVYSLTYKAVKMDMNMGVLRISFDSEDESSDNPIKNQFLSFLNKPMILKMTERGEVTQVGFSDDDLLKQLGDVGSVMVPLPADPIKQGDSWTAERKMPGAGNLNLKMTAEKITADEVIISVEGGIHKKDSDENIDGFTGHYTLDRDSGLTKNGTVELKTNAKGNGVEMKMSFKAVP